MPSLLSPSNSKERGSRKASSAPAQRAGRSALTVATDGQSAHSQIKGALAVDSTAAALVDSRRAVSPPLPLYSKTTNAEDTGAGPGITAPKTGIAAPMMWPFPEHTPTASPSKGAPLIKPRDSVVAEMMARDARRLMHPELVMNRVVYDSISPPPRRASPAVDESDKSSGKGSDGRTTGAVEAVMSGSGVGVGVDGSRFMAAGSHSQSSSAPLGSTCSKLDDWYVPAGPSDHTLVFESRFETGNLRRAIQVYDYEYDIIVKPDVNTRGHTQWFYFSVKNMRRGVKYKLNLINMLKPDSLFNHGMQPCVRSDKMAALHGIGWVRRGTDICYYQNHVKRRGGYYYTATFTMDFPYSDDTVYIAYCYPYTYTDLQRYLHTLEVDPRRRNRFRRRTLCYTLAGNTCDLLTVTSFACDPEALRQRKGIVVSARVHPGESNASWMMKGFIDYLTGPSLDAKILRDNFVFKIVPMLNPDGVIVGNYRCSLAGVDLNRQWKEPSRRLHPTIHHTKEMLRRLCEDRDVIMYCDLHGHSRKRNVFMYGCENSSKSPMHLRERVFPRMLWRNAISFSYEDCNFKVQKAKESTARIVTWREIGLTNSYTMEASFCAPDFGKRNGEQFTVQHFEEMGHFFCDTILDYCDPDQVKVKATIRELEGLYRDGGNLSDESMGSDAGSETEDGPKKRRGKKKRGGDTDRSSRRSKSGGSTPMSSGTAQSGGDSRRGGSGRSRSRGRSDSAKRFGPDSGVGRTGADTPQSDSSSKGGKGKRRRGRKGKGNKAPVPPSGGPSVRSGGSRSARAVLSGQGSDRNASVSMSMYVPMGMPSRNTPGMVAHANAREGAAAASASVVATPIEVDEDKRTEVDASESMGGASDESSVTSLDEDDDDDDDGLDPALGAAGGAGGIAMDAGAGGDGSRRSRGYVRRLRDQRERAAAAVREMGTAGPPLAPSSRARNEDEEAEAKDSGRARAGRGRAASVDSDEDDGGRALRAALQRANVVAQRASEAASLVTGDAGAPVPGPVPPKYPRGSRPPRSVPSDSKSDEDVGDEVDSVSENEYSSAGSSASYPRYPSAGDVVEKQLVADGEGSGSRPGHLGLPPRAADVAARNAARLSGGGTASPIVVGGAAPETTAGGTVSLGLSALGRSGSSSSLDSQSSGLPKLG